jgi:hypothetical protein
MARKILPRSQQLTEREFLSLRTLDLRRNALRDFRYDAILGTPDKHTPAYCPKVLDEIVDGKGIATTYQNPEALYTQFGPRGFVVQENSNHGNVNQNTNHTR